ncbi:MAG: helix-turn-helix transcriptional regulator [Oscillospiraceae bacterium]|nr:helix-turn-helix transcriptional regulator [Oscillospiraceae bacterium]
MDDEKIKHRIGSNIAAYRKRAGLTQAGLAEQLNYSDKAISKWERGESIPDVLTMMQLASQFDITVNELVADPNELPAGPSTKLEKAMTQVSEKALKRKADKNIILWLSSTLVWFVALLVFVIISSFDLPYSWMSFFLAVPVNAIVLLSLRSAWHDFRWNRALISIIMWGFLICIHMSLVVFLNFNMWKLFLLGIPGEFAIFLWFRLFRPVKEPEEEPVNG